MGMIVHDEYLLVVPDLMCMKCGAQMDDDRPNIPPFWPTTGEDRDEVMRRYKEWNRMWEQQAADTGGLKFHCTNPVCVNHRRVFTVVLQKITAEWLEHNDR